MSDNQIRRDLSLKLQADLGAVMERNARVAQAVLTPGEVMVMMIEGAVSMVRSAAATVAASLEEREPGEAFDRTVDAIYAMACSDRDRSLAKISASRAGADQ